MRVAVIGAGAAGLTCARHVAEQGMQCDVFEMGPKLGGIWQYTDLTDNDKYGFPIHSALYKDLRINLAKEVMGYPDFPFPDNEYSFVSHDIVLQYLKDYADHHNLHKLIKLNEMVIELRSLEEKWQIKSLHKPTSQQTTSIYDAVMICNGHFHEPILPNLPGEENFEGEIIHSKQFRTKEPYTNKKVLIIGAGFSGLDIAFLLTKVAHSVVISQRNPKWEPKTEFPPNLFRKPEVRKVKNDSEVEFVDGSSCSFDCIIHCTGYKFSFPFLHESCEVSVEDKRVYPLYKHIIHVEKPTLCFIGLPNRACTFHMFDIQARFFCQYLNGSMTLPSKEEMYKSIEELLKHIKPDEMAHMLGLGQPEYFDDLATMANITPIDSVVSKIWCKCFSLIFEDQTKFSSYKFTIIDKDNFDCFL